MSIKKAIPKSIKNKKVRLVKTVTPLVYRITLAPDLQGHTFSGEETITVQVTKTTNTIVLHAKDLDILSAELVFGKKTLIPKISYQASEETVTLTTSGKIPVGRIKVTLTFQGILQKSMRGFYKSTYVVDGKEHTLATTQFEATDARRCIPCFDEPTHKAVFHVSLKIPIDKTAISNTLPIQSAPHADGFKVVSFAPTPKMSTYLLAFIVGDFECLEKKSKGGVLVRVYATPGKKHQLGFSLDVAVRCLDFYEKYFGIKYPLNTLDMIAIPDFESGAMENWGAVTYRETALLVDPNETSIRTKQWVALVIAHELAHQWFGNLVTMEWWTHLWLNEGFASYIEYLAVDELFPEWDIWTQFAYSDMGVALELDGLQETHPIEIEVHHPSEIGEIFDAVSYSKGASVIRMLATYLGPRDFRDGLRYYLKKHSYQNTETIHLWQAFEKVSKKPVRKMMHLWTSKPGYPLVSVSQDTNEFTLTQERFFKSPLSKKANKENTTWMVPVQYASDRKIFETAILTTKKMKIPHTKEGLWYKFNIGETGLMRVRYTKDLLEKLRHPISSGRLPAVDRFGIIRDLFALTLSGEMPLDEVLDFISVYKNETEYIVWMELLGGIARVQRLVEGTSYEEQYRSFVRSIVSEASFRIGWEKKTGEDHTTTLLRSSLLYTAGFYGEGEIILHAKKLFKNREVEPIDADVRSTVYNLVAQNGGEKEHAQLIRMYKNTELHEEKARILSALGHFTDKKIITKTLAYAFSPLVRLQDRNTLFSSVLQNRHGRDLCWKVIQKNWKEIAKDFGGGHMLSRLVQTLAVFSHKEEAKHIQAFFRTHESQGAERSIRQVIEHILAIDAWRNKEKKRLTAFFTVRS